jgi:signal transduction histidine kinase/ActR/RegA family two-component response regulator
MWMRLQNLLLPAGIFTGSQLERRRNLLRYILILVGACSLPFYAIYHPDYDHAANLVGTAGYWSLWLLLILGAPYAVIANATLLWSIAYVAYLAAYTGGINSPVMVWMTVVLLPAILLLDHLLALFWIAVVFITNLSLLLISKAGWINSDINMDNEVMGWTLANKLFVLAMAMYVVFVSERMHRVQAAEMEQSNAELEATSQALIRAQAHKDEFIASVGHELRTPMNAILGLNSILRAELADKPEDAEVVDHIRRSTEQLLQVVNDILDFSQLQAGQFKLREEGFGLYAMLQELLEQYLPKAKAKNLKLTLDAKSVHSAWVTGDKLRLQQILKNLLDNALKFTAEGEIHIHAQTVGNGVVFEVQDTGIGIAPDRQQQIFNGFEHADVQTNRMYGGTGLGLSICERLVNLQGGHIGVSSAQGHGSKFWFHLPLKSITLRDAPISSDWIKQLIEKPLQILLVDDNAVNLMVARLMLQKLLPRSTVVESNGALDALEKIKAQRFDLILMDMVMPDIDGIQATHMLRQDFSVPVSQTPVIALTASANPVDHDRCLAAGMNEVVNKPLDEQQLLSKITTVLVEIDQQRPTP